MIDDLQVHGPGCLADARFERCDVSDPVTHEDRIRSQAADNAGLALPHTETFRMSAAEFVGSVIVSHQF
jgi:hypothetical protein